MVTINDIFLKKWTEAGTRMEICHSWPEQDPRERFTENMHLHNCLVPLLHLHIVKLLGISFL